MKYIIFIGNECKLCKMVEYGVSVSQANSTGRMNINPVHYWEITDKLKLYFMLQLSICHSAVRTLRLGLGTKNHLVKVWKASWFGLKYLFSIIKLTDGNGPTSWKKNVSFRSPRSNWKPPQLTLKNTWWRQWNGWKSPEVTRTPVVCLAALLDLIRCDQMKRHLK